MAVSHPDGCSLPCFRSLRGRGLLGLRAAGNGARDEEPYVLGTSYSGTVGPYTHGSAAWPTIRLGERMSKTAQNRKKLRKHRRNQWLRASKRDGRTKSGFMVQVFNPNTQKWQRSMV